MYRHDPYNIERDGDVDRTINEVDVGEWKVSVDDTLNSFIQWLRIISTLVCAFQIVLLEIVLQ